MKFNEDSRVKIPAIVHLTRLGYAFLPKARMNNYHGDTNIFIDQFKEGISKINGKEYTDSLISSLITELRQDISQKSSEFLRLNLILNNLLHSLHNVIKGNTLTSPYHVNDEKTDLKKFDYIVSNPPFKTDFSDDRETLTSDKHKKRFFAGVSKVPNKDKDKMAIYPLFIQHIIYSLSAKGKAAVVVPTGFITAQSGIELKIREKLIDDRMLRGVVSMPSNIFATTGTNVSVLFIDKENSKGDVVLMDASKLGTTVKEGKNQRTLLSSKEEEFIINAFNRHEPTEDFSVVVSYDQIKARNYSFSAGQYFDAKMEYIDITPKEFNSKMESFVKNLDSLFSESKAIEMEIKMKLGKVSYGKTK